MPNTNPQIQGGSAYAAGLILDGAGFLISLAALIDIAVRRRRRDRRRRRQGGIAFVRFGSGRTAGWLGAVCLATIATYVTTQDRFVP